MTRTQAYASVQANPQDAQAWLMLGHTLFARQKSAQARCCYQQALNVACSLDEVHSALQALARDEIQWAPLALATCEMIDEVRTTPSEPTSWTLLGDLLTEIGAPGKAMECYQRVLEIDPIFTSSDPNTARVLAAESSPLPLWLQTPEPTRPSNIIPMRRRERATANSTWPLTAA